MQNFKFLVCGISLFFGIQLCAQDIGILKYKGGGDWYANPTALPNLIQFCNQNIDTKTKHKTSNRGSWERLYLPIPFYSHDRAW